MMAVARSSDGWRRMARRGGWLRSLGAVAALIAVMGATSLFAAADDQIFVPGASRSEKPAPTVTSSFNSLSLLLGLALAGVGGWMVWRNRRGKPVGRELRALALDETRSLGNRQYLVVASYEGRKFLLGVCPGRIDMLTPLDGTASGRKSSE